jgi:hypothetical protein
VGEVSDEVVFIRGFDDHVIDLGLHILANLRL